MKMKHADAAYVFSALKCLPTSPRLSVSLSLSLIPTDNFIGAVSRPSSHLVRCAGGSIRLVLPYAMNIDIISDWRMSDIN